MGSLIPSGRLRLAGHVGSTMMHLVGSLDPLLASTQSNDNQVIPNVCRWQTGARMQTICTNPLSGNCFSALEYYLIAYIILYLLYLLLFILPSTEGKPRARRV